MAERGRAAATAAFVVVAGRVLLLLLAATAAVAGLVVATQRADPNDGIHYGCPMHLAVTSPTRGVCSLCGMALVPLHAGVNDANPGLHPEIAAMIKFDMHPMRVRSFSEQVRAPAWVEDDGAVTALLYKDELETLAPGGAGAEERGTFVPTASPATSAAVRLVPGAPRDWDRSMVRLRFQPEKAAAGAAGAVPLRAGDAGWVTLAPKQHQVLVVPWAAVVHGAEGPYVMIASEDGRTLRKQPIELGKVFFDLGAVVSGLKGGERVPVDSAFFLDAEERLRAAYAP